jgi:hypothetical protein
MPSALEVAGGRGEKQRAIIGQSLRAYDDALCAVAGLTRLANEKRGDRAKIHRRTLAKQA